MIIEKYPYQEIKRTYVGEKRFYETKSGLLPSVTTILDKTKPAETVQKLNEWRERVGHKEAQRITSEAASVGTLMHGFLEEWLKRGKWKAGKNFLSIVTNRMAETIVDGIKNNLDEVWGSEVNLYYPGLYAGTTDLVGVWKGSPSIMDFKQTNRPKKKEWIEDYFLQACLYAAAHDVLFGTNIESAAIFMCSRDCKFQLFEITGDEFKHYSVLAAKRIEQFYNLQ